MQLSGNFALALPLALLLLLLFYEIIYFIL
jgi:hypothetical protein